MSKNPFITNDGKVINDLTELYLTLSQMDDAVFSQHVNQDKNDFSNWLHYKGHNDVAESIKTAESKSHASEILKTFIESRQEEPKTTKLKTHKRKAIKKGNKTKQDNNISQTGIKELDNILNGGIPKSSIVLLTGNAGTGKTTLAMQWLYNGAEKFTEPGLYFALTEPITKTIRNISSFSFYKPSSASKVHLTDLRSVMRLLGLKDKKITEDEIDKILDAIKSISEKTKAKRIVIDSITALCYILDDKNLIRNFIFRLGNILNDLKSTIILTSELSGEGYSVFGTEEFIADGIIKVEQRILDDDVIRFIQIAKMRGVLYNPEVHKFRISEKGIYILKKVKPELDFASSKKLLSSGIRGMNSMLGGGLFEGSTTLLAGSAGAGKSLLAIQFLYEGLKKRQPGLLISFEESKSQILRNAKSIGKDLKKYLDKGLLQMINIYPDKLLPEEHIINIAKTIKKHNIKRCVLDSLSALSTDISKDALSDFFKKLNVYLKSHLVTTIFTCATQMQGEHLIEFHMQSTTDNIIVLKFVEIDSEMRLMIGVLKTRGTRHDKKLREYAVTNRGIVLKDSFKNVEGLFIGNTSRKVDTKLLKAFEELSKGQ